MPSETVPTAACPVQLDGPTGDSAGLVLGLETSCDETAAAVVRADRTILSNTVVSQLEEHRRYGGVVPEVAARAHLGYLPAVIRAALETAEVGVEDLTAIAATGGPGLIGGVMVGVMTAKAMAAARGLPFIAVNHLEAHALTARLTNGIAFPYLLLLVSGGHCQLVAVLGVGRYRRMGTTIDDAVGEAFDKTAKVLDLGYPGGPRVEQAAAAGDPDRFPLPRPMIGRPGCDFSFSGLKTAVKQAADALPPGPFAPRDVADLAAAFQAAVVDSLCDRTDRALAAFATVAGSPPTAPVAGTPPTATVAGTPPTAPAVGTPPTALVVAGGVAANGAVRAGLQAVAARAGVPFLAPPPALCTDNGAMVAWAGHERLALGLTDGLGFRPRPRWPLDPDAVPALGKATGKAGVKA